MTINLRSARKAAGFTQAEFAEKMHVTQQAVTSWEIGNTIPQADRLFMMAEVLNVSLLSVLYNDEFVSDKELDYTVEVEKNIKVLEAELKETDSIEARLSLLNEKAYYAEHKGKCFYKDELTDYEFELYQHLKDFLSASEIVDLLNKRRKVLGNKTTVIEPHRIE